MNAEEVARLLREAEDLSEQVPCTRTDGNYCRTHYDTDLCPSCAVTLAIDRAYRALTGEWVS